MNKQFYALQLSGFYHNQQQLTQLFDTKFVHVNILVPVLRSPAVHSAKAGFRSVFLPRNIVPTDRCGVKNFSGK